MPTDTKCFSTGNPNKKIGNKSSDTAELYFDNYRVPARYLLGEENQGFFHIMTNFQGERLGAAIGATAGMQLAVEDAIAYAREREAFGRPLIAKQVWRQIGRASCRG